MAASGETGDIDAVITLLEAGANVHAVDEVILLKTLKLSNILLLLSI